MRKFELEEPDLELYDSLKVHAHHENGAIYLSEGMWLLADGTMWDEDEDEDEDEE